jgi:hypothetical protein
MLEYEIRVLNEDLYSESLIVKQLHLNDLAAIRAGARLANGAGFEVWRDLDCIHGLASGHPVRRRARTARA